MSAVLTPRIIKLLCGRIAFEIGESYYKARKVELTLYDPEACVYKGKVKGKVSYQVEARIDAQADVTATCTCPALDSYDHYCEHIAAVLLHIGMIQHAGKPPVRAGVSLLQSDTADLSAASTSGRFTSDAFVSGTAPDSDRQLTDHMLGLFGEKPLRSGSIRALFETREALEAEFTLKTFSYGFRKIMFGLELKLGTRRLYIVQRLKEFLESCERKKPFIFSKHFTYDPKLHSFRKEDDAVIQQLLHICRNEQIYRETSSLYTGHAKSAIPDRLLLIPPYAWEPLLPLLMAAPSVKLEQEDRKYEKIQLTQEPVPLQFEFDESQAAGYEMEIQGLDTILVLESYGIAVSDGMLHQMQTEACSRLGELKRMLDHSSKNRIRIEPQQMEPFMEKVIPGLMKLGSVRIAPAVSNRILHTQLTAKLYLDRVRDRLLASLEFQYGDIVINPLESPGQRRGEGRILMRDGDQETRILELMEEASFAKTEAGYFLNGEEEEYDFLYHIVPQLEKLVRIYATSAVKSRIYNSPAPPKVRVNVDERTDWLDFRFEIAGIPENEIRSLMKSVQEKRRYYRMPDGALLPLESAEFQEIVRLLNEVGIQPDDLQGAALRLPVWRGLHLTDAPQRRSIVKLGHSFRQLLENMRNPDNLDFPVPAHLSSVLREYQTYGYQWMKTLAHYRFGGILADDMGLGKTLQSIAFLVSVLPEIRLRQQPAIIVSPASLLYNWRNELTKFAPEVRAVIADGSKTDRSRILRNASQADVVITSYPLLRRDVDWYAKQSFHTLILDEAQAFKNHYTQTAQVVKEIQAVHRFALTGTPVENSLEELWSIFDIVFPELFPERKLFTELSRESVAQRIRPFLLRRLKSDVLKELPEKIESLQASQLLPEQKKLYVSYLAKLQQETLKHLHEKGFQRNRIRILAGLTRLRQLCCHPALFVHNYEGSSAKFEQLLEIVEECRSAGKRVLVFSQFTEMLGLIGRELGFRGIPFFYLDGQTPAPQRVELCSRFNEGERDLFLISLKAGGTGLNLTGADTVILYDLWWNPAVEQQAADRAHRMGQQKVVQVIRLVAEGTVEDKMYELQQRKKNLIDEVIQPGHEALSSLSEQDIREILMLQ
ncbi:DEAD/DEAH box helicase [Paenibacillus lutrae]|uniref:Helicase SNF n=1 Tax=Paenibacillus lutrae TaxID=2078573 RepID=A0A7X3K150_9BACL|nr:DEAD/DEAH box helicase [Paenibacillus lutrae]MVP01883.1 helicase SNF [Paenibacillus lutrae]